jgi:hypothetical protein
MIVGNAGKVETAMTLGSRQARSSIIERENGLIAR